MVDLFEKCKGDGGFFGWYRVHKDRYFQRPILEGLPGPHMKWQGKDVIMWAINSYTGLAGNEEIKQVALESVRKWGTFTPMGSRMLTGNTTAHEALEASLAEFLQKPASILFNYGYLGVLGSVSAFVGPDDEIVVDKLSHASMIDATILASAGRRFRPFKHNDMNDLESQLKASSRDRKGGILVVTEGVFGMRGDLARLKEICELKDRYGARLFVDDAHGFGVMGADGRGTGEHLGVQDKVDLYFGTFAKTFAAIGGVTAGPEDAVEYIRYNARSNVFAKALPMVYVDVIAKSLQVMKSHPELRVRMWQVAKRLQDGLTSLGFDIGDTQSPVTPIYVPAGDEQVGQQMIRTLREEHGVFVSGVAYPVVPRGVILFRMIPTSLHSDEDVDKTVAAFRALRDGMKLDLSLKPSQVNR